MFQWEIKSNGLFHWKFFGKKGIITSTMFHDEIRGFFQPCLLLQILEPIKLSQKKSQLCVNGTRSSRSILFEEKLYCYFRSKILTAFSKQMEMKINVCYDRQTLIHKSGSHGRIKEGVVGGGGGGGDHATLFRGCFRNFFTGNHLSSGIVQSPQDCSWSEVTLSPKFVSAPSL